MNIWKIATLTLLAVLVLVSGRWIYWHERWHDEELYRLRIGLTGVVQYLNTNAIKP